jgi:hypothetical protein
MSALTRLASACQLATPATPVYRDECSLSFYSTYAPHGLYVNLATFLSYHNLSLDLSLKGGGGGVYLRITSVKRVKEGAEGTVAAPTTKLGVGIEGTLRFSLVLSLSQSLAWFANSPHPSILRSFISIP